MQHVSFITITPTLKKAVDRYYKELTDYVGKAEHETAIRSAFQNLLAEFARSINWTLIPEETLEHGIRPDGTFRDNAYRLQRGHWEAKDTKDDLEKEIQKKIKKGYPLTNIIFENSQRAILYQNKKRYADYNLAKKDQLIDLLRQFFSYTEPEIETFEAAVQEFKERIPELAKSIVAIIQDEHRVNKRFRSAFEAFAAICRTSLNPQLSDVAIDEMLVQHILTARLFRTVFNNADFTKRNIIASEIEKVIDALTSRSFSLNDFLKPLDRFYVAIELAAKGIDTWTERQHFLNTVYERFFQGYSVKDADTHGIVYTPQEIVNFMVASVDEVLQREFHTAIEEPSVQILDPAVGTGSFIVNILHRISRSKLKYKYQNDLFCNEIMLLPYYIASLNIEHEYYERMGEYEPFEGIAFADTLELAEGRQLSWIVEENTERVQRQKAAQIMVVIGNPPYNMGQKNENDNNKNRPYPVIDERIHETYAKASKATLTNKLYDAYARFFRWATDRLQGRDGIVCFVSNNSFIDQIAFDGMRQHLLKDFTSIYHLDLRGNVRKNPKLSGTTHNVFGIQVGVGITIAVRSLQNTGRAIYYYRVPEDWTKTEKLNFIKDSANFTSIAWQELQPDAKNTWLTEGMRSEFTTFLPMGTKEAKSGKALEAQTIFKLYSLGVATNRDEWVYDFEKNILIEKVKRLILNYNSEVFRWSQEPHIPTTSKQQKEAIIASIDEFVNNDPTFLKWTDLLKDGLYKGKMLTFDEEKVRTSVYRPFCKQFLYFDALLNQRRYQQHLIFPNLVSETENVVICVTGIGSSKPFQCLTSNIIPCLDMLEKTQCFPYYTYAEDGTNRRENITEWALQQFQAQYSEGVSKWDIFHYVYALLHHPQYRERYAENLKRDLPHIPLLKTAAAFETCVSIGKQLMELHLHYEQAREYQLTWVENETTPSSWRVEKMHLTADYSTLVVNDSLILANLPQECFAYRLGNRSALEWVIDQYQISVDKRSGIVSDPNNLDNEQYIVRLVGKVITVSVETVKLVNELASKVSAIEWLAEGVTHDVP